jgi:hypothetical protein
MPFKEKNILKPKNSKAKKSILSSDFIFLIIQQFSDVKFEKSFLLEF